MQIGTLLFDKASTIIPTEYFDYNDVLSTKNITELAEYNRIIDHAIDLEEDKQLLFKPIYSLGPVELETLKTYIKTNLTNGFIQPSQSLAKAPILFD